MHKEERGQKTGFFRKRKLKQPRRYRITTFLCTDCSMNTQLPLWLPCTPSYDRWVPSLSLPAELQLHSEMNAQKAPWSHSERVQEQGPARTTVTAHDAGPQPGSSGNNDCTFMHLAKQENIITFCFHPLWRLIASQAPKLYVFLKINRSYITWPQTDRKQELIAVTENQCYHF